MGKHLKVCFQSLVSFLFVFKIFEIYLITIQEIIFLTLIFLILTFLAATQDVCVDGWAISLLSRENVAWQSTCNNVGFLAGNLVSNTCFVILESAWFSNKYIRPVFGLAEQNYGVIGLESKMKMLFLLE
jgi:hypothetical protein